MHVAPLPPERLRTVCDPSSLGFSSTAEIDDADVGFIHARAIGAIRLGLDIEGPGYNLFVLGDTGSGRHDIVARLLENERHRGAPPADWCYVWNFAQASQPRLLRLPCGRGAGFRSDMERFVEELMPAIGAVFESDDYRNRIEALQEDAKQREEAALRTLGDEAQKLGIALLRTPHGFAFLPMKDAESTLSQDEFEKLPEARQKELGDNIKLLHERMHRLMGGDFPRWRRELQNRIRDAGRDALGVTVRHMIEELKPAYADLPEVSAHLDAVLQDIIASGESLHAAPHADEDADTVTYSGTITVQRYLVNLLVENPADGTRPVVCEDHPTLQNLVGRIDHLVHMGTLVSNFTLIRAGALHRANGGFLVVDAVKLLSQPFAWEGLKRALKSGRLRIESLSELIGVTGSVQLEPEPLPLDLKVILIGERLIYYLLTQYDPEFAPLFRINADMESEIVRTQENTAAYAHLIAGRARHEALPPLSAAAVARLIDDAARQAGDAERLSARTQALDDRLREAAHFATAAGRPQIEREHVEAALTAHRQRHERIRLHYQQEIQRGQLLVDTDGEHVGQVNGLAVIPLGEDSFAHPVRITATVRVGEGEVIDIEREVKLGGPIHAKGVLILSSFVASRFGMTLPLSLKASLVFEQSYGGIEGDSASLAELAALLSALAGVPVRQSIAVTGSINQFGIVQPVGGINEKIEGFFDLCAARGLTGEQGVLIPHANVCHLMLREDVVAAVRDGRFRIWAVTDVDEALERLTGLPAGAPDANGRMEPEDSVNGRVAGGLKKLAQLRREFNASLAGRRSDKRNIS
ncbi:ATP-dependent protease La Type II [Thauera humireducens]|uniref:Lon protease family protein n=1 Tax=Thauera humireducens TaxID=1134435 RepID=UPI002467A285|nr:AAA family ATPase [Thauera humireducens]CAH1747409.1 ATP-dependent protease La Type II [Thauera humireducens]